MVTNSIFVNYTIVSYCKGTCGYDSYGDVEITDAIFRLQHYVDQEIFLINWAEATFKDIDIIILLDGKPECSLSDIEFEEYTSLETKMNMLRPAINERIKRETQLRKEQAAEAAVQKARKIAADQRKQDLRNLEDIKRRLGLE